MKWIRAWRIECESSPELMDSLVKSGHSSTNAGPTNPCTSNLAPEKWTVLQWHNNQQHLHPDGQLDKYWGTQ